MGAVKVGMEEKEVQLLAFIYLFVISGRGECVKNVASLNRCRDGVGFYPGIYVPSGVQLRKVSHWPPWLIKIFRKSMPGVHKRELLGHADFSVVGDLAEDRPIVGHHDHGPSRIKMFRDNQLTGSPYYVRAYLADKS